MTFYIIGVIVAFILYRIGRYIELNYKHKLKGEFVDTTWGEACLFYILISCSWVGVVLFGFIVGMMLSEINKGKKLPKWL